MIVEKQNDPYSFSFDASLDDWERLIRWIDKKYITELVKRDKHLQQHEFRGFRPDHLPWDRVPKVVARHAQTCDLTRNTLLSSWHTSNIGLIRKAKEEVLTDAIEDSVASLLASLGRTEKHRDQLLWALKIDEREEVRAALTDGLQEALLNKSSSLLTKVEKYAQAIALDRAKQEIDDLKVENGQLKI